MVLAIVGGAAKRFTDLNDAERERERREAEIQQQADLNWRNQERALEFRENVRKRMAAEEKAKLVAATTYSIQRMKEKLGPLTISDGSPTSSTATNQVGPPSPGVGATTQDEPQGDIYANTRGKLESIAAEHMGPDKHFLDGGKAYKAAVAASMAKDEAAYKYRMNLNQTMEDIKAVLPEGVRINPVKLRGFFDEEGKGSKAWTDVLSGIDTMDDIYGPEGVQLLLDSNGDVEVAMKNAKGQLVPHAHKETAFKVNPVNEEVRKGISDYVGQHYTSDLSEASPYTGIMGEAPITELGKAVERGAIELASRTRDPLDGANFARTITSLTPTLREYLSGAKGVEGMVLSPEKEEATRRELNNLGGFFVDKVIPAYGSMGAAKDVMDAFTKGLPVELRAPAEIAMRDGIFSKVEGQHDPAAVRREVSNWPPEWIDAWNDRQAGKEAVRLKEDFGPLLSREEVSTMVAQPDLGIPPEFQERIIAAYNPQEITFEGEEEKATETKGTTDEKGEGSSLPELLGTKGRNVERVRLAQEDAIKVDPAAFEAVVSLYREGKEDEAVSQWTSLVKDQVGFLDRGFIEEENVRMALAEEAQKEDIFEGRSRVSAREEAVRARSLEKQEGNPKVFQAAIELFKEGDVEEAIARWSPYVEGGELFKTNPSTTEDVHRILEEAANLSRLEDTILQSGLSGEELNDKVFQSLGMSLDEIKSFIESEESTPEKEAEIVAQLVEALGV